MKLRLALAILTAAFTIFVGTLLADHDNGKHRGWERENHPNHYGSPGHHHGHP